MQLREAAERVRHDLGKYVHLEARWLGEDADEAELRAALHNDLARTRRHPAGDEGCDVVWARLRPDVTSLEIAELDSIVLRLSDAARKLDQLDHPRLRAVAEDARLCADACRRLAQSAAG